MSDSPTLQELSTAFAEDLTTTVQAVVPQCADTELQASIARLQLARAEVATLLEHRVPADVPAGFETVAPLMSEPDRSIVAIYGQLYDEQAMADVQRMIARDADEESRDLDRTIAEAMNELYTPAQRDVLRRILLLTRSENAQNDADPQPGR